MADNDFLIKEFEENWSYLRHLEETRLKILQMYLLVYGAVLGIVGYLAKGSDKADTAQSLICSIERFGLLYLGLFLFLFLYGVALTVFQARQKNGYEHYRSVNASIRNELGRTYSERIPFQISEKLSEVEGEVYRSPFFWWLFSMILVNASALFFFLLFLLTLLHSKESVALIIPVLISLIACYIEWMLIKPQQKNNKKGKTPNK